MLVEKLTTLCGQSRLTTLSTAVLGIWSGNACFGNIVGTALVAVMFYLFDKTVAWKVAMIAAIVYVFLVPDPKDALYRHTSLEEAKPESVEMKTSPTTESSSESESEEVQGSKGISFLSAWCIPGVSVLLREQCIRYTRGARTNRYPSIHAGLPVRHGLRLPQVRQLRALLLDPVLLDRIAQHDQLDCRSSLGALHPLPYSLHRR